MPGAMDAPTDEPRDARPSAPPPTASGLREMLTSVQLLGRIAWFALGALCATAVTLGALRGPWGRRGGEDSAVPYEGFPFADNAGVCQEYVALATLRTSHADAQAITQRLVPALPPALHAENLRVVRAFAPGDFWTVAVDAQSGTGDQARATEVAGLMNSVAGTGLRFEPVFYASRRLYDTAHVLCMPRQSGAVR